MTTTRRLIGTVVSDAMDQTVVVAVERLTTHPKYRKQYRVRRKFKAHNPNNAYHTGDRVEIAESRPRSREKRWLVVRQLTGGQPSPAVSPAAPATETP